MKTDDTVLKNVFKKNKIMRTFLLTILLTLCVYKVSFSDPPILKSENFFGGAGDQRGTAIAIFNDQLCISGIGVEAQDSIATSLLLRYNLPVMSATAPIWNKTFNFGTNWYGVAATHEGVYATGQSWDLTNDTSGGKEVKSIIMKFYPDGSNGSGYGGSIWTKTNNNFFVYSGVEFFRKSIPAFVDGKLCIYTAGFGQPCSSSAAYMVAKYDSAGNFLAAATDATVGINFGNCYVPSGAGGSSSFECAYANGSVYVAGASGWVIEGDSYVRPTIWAYDKNLSTIKWRGKDGLHYGELYGVRVAGGYVYGVGYTSTSPDTTGLEDYYICKYDTSGNFQWARVYSGSNTDMLTSIVVMQNRLFATGYTRSYGSGDANVVLMELDAVTGDTISTQLYGGAQDDFANGIILKDSDLYIVGESRSFAFNGNIVGQNDVMLLRYEVPKDKLPGEYSADSNTVLLMHMNEPGTLVRDDSYYRNNGNAGSGAISVTPEGKFGAARVYNGPTQAYVEVPSSTTLTLGNSDFTLEFWVKTSATYTQRFLYRYSGSSDNFWDIYQWDGKLSMTIYPTGFYRTMSGEKIINDGKWHHVAAIRSGGYVRLYLDGVLQCETDIPNTNPIDTNAGYLYVGGPGGNCPTAILDEVRISNIVRSPGDFYLQLPPINFNAYVGGSDVFLDWSNGGGMSPFMEYRIYHSYSDSNSMSHISSTSNQYYIHYSPGNGHHYYRVTAVDSTGFESALSYAVHVRIGDSNPPVIVDYTLHFNVDVQNGHVVNPPCIYGYAYDDESSVTYFAVRYKKWGVQDSTDLQFSSPTGPCVNIPENAFINDYGYPNGVSYKLIAMDSKGNIAETEWKSFNVRNTASVTSPVEQPSANNFQDNMIRAYRLVSIPYDLDDKRPSSVLPQSFGDHYEKNMPYARWRFQVLRNNMIYEDYETCKDQPLFEIGRAHFLIVKDGGRRLRVGSGEIVNAETIANTGIPLDQGWNLVGNPFNFNFPVDRLEFDYTIQQIAYYSGSGAFDGWEIVTFTSNTTIKPWDGLAIRVNAAGYLRFKMPGIGLANIKPLPINIMQRISHLEKNSEMDWLLQIDVERIDNKASSKGNFIGMAKDAKPGDDKYDMFMPPFLSGKNAVIYFENEAGEMLRDIRPVNNEGEAWNMHLLTGDENARVLLRLPEKLQLPNPEFGAYLIDLDKKMAYDLKQLSEIEVNSDRGKRNFRIVVGKNNYIEQNSNGIAVIPKEIKLYANYPNPFNPETVIRYTLPYNKSLYKVNLKIYNMLGQEIAALVDKQQPTGYYEVRWNAGNVSSGIYFYRISVSDGVQEFHDVKKMVVIK